MKVCKKCYKDFPSSIVIEGRRRNLKNRDFCFECSPFGAHNNRDLVKEALKDPNKRICSKCSLEKNNAEFYILGNGKLFSWCSECHKTTNKQKAREFKIKCVEYKGSKCTICNYDKCLGALEFHHLDASQKEFTISSKQLLLNFNQLKSELDKCILVCSNCHAELHYS